MDNEYKSQLFFDGDVLTASEMNNVIRGIDENKEQITAFNEEVIPELSLLNTKVQSNTQQIDTLKIKVPNLPSLSGQYFLAGTFNDSLTSYNWMELSGESPIIPGEYLTLEDLVTYLSEYDYIDIDKFNELTSDFLSMSDVELALESYVTQDYLSSYLEDQSYLTSEDIQNFITQDELSIYLAGYPSVSEVYDIASQVAASEIESYFNTNFQSYLSSYFSDALVSYLDDYGGEVIYNAISQYIEP